MNGIPLSGATDDFVAGIKLAHRFAPAGGRQFHREIGGSNFGEDGLEQVIEVVRRAKAKNLYKVEMRHAINQPARRHPTDPLVVIGIDLVDIAPGELSLLSGVIERPSPRKKWTEPRTKSSRSQFASTQAWP